MNTQLLEYTQTQQSVLANYVRTGELNHVDGLTENRVHYYRRLIHNVVNESLQTAFPITYDLLTEDEWDALVDNFFGKHDCKSNELWKMPYEFYQFIVSGKSKLISKYPHLYDLLLLEWTEIEIYMMEDVDLPKIRTVGNFYKSIFVTNPEHKILELDYPVHLKNSKEISKSDKGNYFVLIYRQPETFKVRFINLSVYYAWLIENLATQSQTLNDIYEAAEGIFDVGKKTLDQNTYQFIIDMINNKFILGFRNDNN